VSWSGFRSPSRGLEFGYRSHPQPGKNAAPDARGSTRLSQCFCRYDASRDGDRDSVRQVYAAQFVARRIQIGLYASERQIQNPGNVVVSLASRRPDQTLLLSFRQFDRLGRQFEIDPAAELINTSIGYNFTICCDLYSAQSSFE
jgi:hypothetical protein